MGTEYALERIIRPYPYIWLEWLQKYPPISLLGLQKVLQKV